MVSGGNIECGVKDVLLTCSAGKEPSMKCSPMRSCLVWKKF